MKIVSGASGLGEQELMRLQEKSSKQSVPLMGCPVPSCVIYFFRGWHGTSLGNPISINELGYAFPLLRHKL
jgi:hypothetical protein